MNKSWAGPAVIAVIVLGIGSFLFLNLETRERSTVSAVTQAATALPPVSAAGGVAGAGAPIREFPIGDEVEQNQIRVAAVWLPAVQMDDMPADPAMPMIHIEADVKALANNPNGFAKDEKVDYLKIAYTLVPAAGGTALAQGDLSPMMARDGFHYGASIALPKPGRYRLVYHIQPPSAGGLGRHSDAATGVAEWWRPFDATFEWTIEPDTDPKITTR